jgi:hypothetical protein
MPKLGRREFLKGLGLAGIAAPLSRIASPESKKLDELSPESGVNLWNQISYERWPYKAWATLGGIRLGFLMSISTQGSLPWDDWKRNDDIRIHIPSDVALELELDVGDLNYQGILDLMRYRILWCEANYNLYAFVCTVKSAPLTLEWEWDDAKVGFTYRAAPETHISGKLHLHDVLCATGIPRQIEDMGDRFQFRFVCRPDLSKNEMGWMELRS